MALSGLAVSALGLAGCGGGSEPLRDMVGYVPPTSLPAAPKRTLVRAEPEETFGYIVDYLRQTDFTIEHQDEEKLLIVARYAGTPEPYVDCGSIVTHQQGSLSQLSGSADSLALNYKLEDEPVILQRDMHLDSRIIIQVAPTSSGSVVQSETTYVVTKSINIEADDGAVRDGSRETISFSSGRRGEFEKGTSCQPNGALDFAMVQSLPDVIGTRAIAADEPPLTVDGIGSGGGGEDSTDAGATPPAATVAAATDLPPTTVPQAADSGTAATASDEPNWDEFDWVLPEDGLPQVSPPSADAAASPAPAATAGAAAAASAAGASAGGGAAVSAATPDAPAGDITVAAAPVRQEDDWQAPAGADTGSIVDETTRALLAALDCQGTEWHFCRLVELASPYRKANIEEGLGLSVNTTESFASQVIGDDLRLDVQLPNFPSHLHVGYLQRDDTLGHVMSSSEEWPAGLSHHIEGSGYSVPAPAGIAMFIAVATEQPLFENEPPRLQPADEYFAALEQRLEAIKASGSDKIAVSHLLINANAGTQ
jgi:hypothetical protein